MTNVCLASTRKVLEMLGFDAKKIETIEQMYKEDGRAVTLRFAATETCEFETEKKVVVDGSKEVVLTSSNDTIRCRVKNTVTEYHWKFGLEYNLIVYVGNDPETSSRTILQSRKSDCIIITKGNKKSPRPASTTNEPIDIQITWLLQHISDSNSFCIDRSVGSCHTPRRNKDIDDALIFFHLLMVWGNSIHSYFVHCLAGGTVSENENVSSITPHTHADLAAINVRKVFVPVLPLFHDSDDSSSSEEGTILTTTEVTMLLDEMTRTMKEKVKVLTTSFPSAEGHDLISVAEAKLSIAALLSVEVSKYYLSSVTYIEKMLRNQLVQALGKEIGPTDFDQFSQFQCCKIFKKEFCPQSLSYAIRRPGHYPDGTLSIETDPSSQASGRVDPISVLTREIDTGHYPMFFNINAATKVEFTGKKFIHSWLLHSFSSNQSTKDRIISSRHQKSFAISARARQFSSFMLLIGKITASDVFQPEHAIILKNKDEVLIPLLLEHIPTAKEFKDAIESLSPEQKEFASKFRQMQLETSVFAMCVIQLKPQLELLLGLPQHSLTKEIQLTQDLLSLFIDYQIPSDLLTFDGDESLSLLEKIRTVKGHVKAVLDTIATMKDQEVKEAEQAADMRFETMSHTSIDSEPVNAPGSRALKLRGSSKRLMFGGSSGRSAPPQASPLPLQAGQVQQAYSYSNNNASKQSSAEMSSSYDVETLDAQHEPSMDNILNSIPKSEDLSTPTGSTSLDFTQIPRQLDKRFEQFDIESALKSTKIKTSSSWKRKSSKNSLLLSPESEILTLDEQNTEKTKALDLLDALSRCGSLPIASADLHVVLATTHCFDKSLISTIIEDNINPMEKIEKSLLIIGSTIFGTSAKNLLKSDDGALTKRIAAHSPKLLED